MLPLSVWAQSDQDYSAQSNSFYSQASTGGSGSLTIFNQLQSQQDAINQLRGQIEELQHQLEEQKQLSQQRYLDLDERISGNSGGGSRSSDSVSGDTADASSDPINAAAMGGGTAAAEGSASNSSSNPSSGDAQQAYQSAFELVQARQFDQAISALEQFNQDYPNSSLNANAYYWLGELYSAKSQLSDSAQAFQTVIDKYPSSSKVADALYKLGLVKARQGQGSASQTLLNRVIKEYPDSSAATMAQDFLKRTSG
ncbi:tol-pal system protein YbgF [Phytohalomonas tamaricis]|uniref:tol-pal system protein YbgF n=1 Tax=Phytohalomonas tamaricis TaxID=2081032 RepID=UPI002948C435|nr:tol-pal system protein YbgF [Phytohalomonas tamaricis]